jgi:hypothetical protein
VSGVHQPKPTLRCDQCPWPRRLAWLFFLSGGWLFCFALASFFLPQFDPIFARLAEKDSLTLLQFCIYAFSRLNTVMFGLPVLIFYVAVLSADLAIARTTAKMRSSDLAYKTWVGAVSVSGLFSTPALFIAFLSITIKLTRG